MESLKTVMVANLGTTAEPVIKALETAASEGIMTIYLAYGKAFSAQERTPFDEAHKVSERAKQLGVHCRMSELATPEEFEGCFKFYQSLVEEVKSSNPDKVIIDITGGTKVMSAAIVHAALTQQWDAEVVFGYVGGLRDTSGRVSPDAMELKIDSGIITRERVAAVLNSIKRQEFANALFLAGNLPESGKAGFLRKAAGLIWHWDNFHYQQADQQMKEIIPQAKILVEDAQFQRIAGTILRLEKISGRMKAAITALGAARNIDGTSMNPSAMEGWLAILGDTIANARRRAQTDPVDCVLRCYRAIEVSTQIAVFKLGINPWKPDWKKLENGKRGAYLARIHVQEPPDKISMDNGIKLIEVLTSQLSEDVIKDIRDIGTARNFSYLEHGYGGVTEQTSLSLMEKMEKIPSALLSRAGINDNPLDIAKQLRIEA